MVGEIQLDCTLAMPADLSRSGDGLRMKGTNKNLLINLADTATMLGYKDVSDIVSNWVETHGKKHFDFPISNRKTKSTPGRPTTYDGIYAKEGTWYEIVLLSRKPKSNRLRELVCWEILPSIRQYGCYPPPAEQPQQPQPSAAEMLAQMRTEMQATADAAAARAIAQAQTKTDASLASIERILARLDQQARMAAVAANESEILSSIVHKITRQDPTKVTYVEPLSVAKVVATAWVETTKANWGSGMPWTSVPADVRNRFLADVYEALPKEVPDHDGAMVSLLRKSEEGANKLVAAVHVMHVKNTVMRLFGEWSSQPYTFRRRGNKNGQPKGDVTTAELMAAVRRKYRADKAQPTQRAFDLGDVASSRN